MTLIDSALLVAFSACALFADWILQWLAGKFDASLPTKITLRTVEISFDFILILFPVRWLVDDVKELIRREG